MNEIKFLHKNRRKWEEFEEILQGKNISVPDRLPELYIKLNDDLSYARTYFPDTETTHYLNNITQKAHSAIYQHKASNKKDVLKFWKYDFPLVVYQSRKEITVAFTIFIISVLIGLLSNSRDHDFVRTILGDKYVNMTLANIEKGDPMAVYKEMNETSMFLGISLNNIKVSFMAFVFGIFTALGSGYVLVSNGVMLGTFQGFLASKGLLLESMATVWIHGTLEIWAIIVAGASGIIIGNSIVFPRSYTRIVSFQKGIKRGVKLVFGLIPIFLIAGFLEGFVTRHTEYSYTVRFSIIGISLVFIIFYFIIYPITLNKQIKNGKQLH